MKVSNINPDTAGDATLHHIHAEPFRICLSPSEHQKVADIIKGLPFVTLSDMDDDLLATLELAAYTMPKRLVKLLLGFRQRSNSIGHLLIENLPQDSQLPPTPADGRPSALKSTLVSEYALLLTQLILGDPISYMDEKEGNLIQNICPIKGRESQQENSGSTLLEFHTEDGFHPDKPEYLALYCLRCDHDQAAVTYTSSIREVIQSLPASAIEVLRLPLFHIAMSASFGAASGKSFSPLMPVLTGSFFEPDMCVDFFAMAGVDTRATTALKLLERALLKARRGYRLEPGQMLVIDNRTAVHGRSSFTPRYDGADRWLQRLFTVRDARSASFSRIPGSRMQAPLSLLTLNVKNH